MYLHSYVIHYAGAVAPLYLSLLPPNCTQPKGEYIWYTKDVVDWVHGPLPSDEPNEKAREMLTQIVQSVYGWPHKDQMK